MAEKTYPMTIEEKEKLEKELEELKLVRRPEIVERIKIARSYGDLSENSEYEAAKDEQAFVEGQISSIETKIRYAEIVNSDSVAKDEVAIGKTVTVQEVGENYGIPVIAVATLEDLIAFLADSPDLAANLAAVQGYRKQYGISVR